MKSRLSENQINGISQSGFLGNQTNLKSLSMKNISLLIILAVFAYACGSSQASSDKLSTLKALKEQQRSLATQIADLERELIESGELEQKANSTVLVTTLPLKPAAFEHKIEVRGAVASRKNVMISSETMGKVDAINVREGQTVTKGQLLVQLDADVLRGNIAEVKTQLEMATTVFERQENLWKQKIGTEIQYLQAKNNKESLERRLSTLNTQLRQANIYAPYDGVIDNIPVKVGEVIQPGIPLLRIVNQTSMYVAADISEYFLGRFTEGQEVEVFFPAQNKRLTSKISAVGQVIKSENRTFEIEVQLPNVDFAVKPNQVVVLNLVDYKNEMALVVPTKLIQRDSKGSYIYELVSEDGKTIASKVYVKPGVSYDLNTEVVEGLKEGQLLALEGYRDLAQGVIVTISK